MMDEQTRAELQSILDSWGPYSSCPCCGSANPGTAVYRTIIARNGHEFYDLVKMDIIHNNDCPYTRIARLIGRDGHQLWQEEPFPAQLIVRLGE